MVPFLIMEKVAIPETTRPGVYQMLSATGEILYVGKARNLKRRISSYFRSQGLSPKTQALMSRVSSIEVIATHTESEALILENNLIKKHRPRYNILLRDDKSYPYIYLTADHPYPRLGLHRGVRKGNGRYFGPFPGAGAVRESLKLMQKLFPVRQCDEGFYRNRTRPCLQYQIGRCSAPCVGLIDPESYAQDVRHAVLFLEGKSSDVIEELATRMEQAAESLQYEEAARLRDQIVWLKRIQERQYVSNDHGDLDVVAIAEAGGVVAIQLFNVRFGQNLGGRSHFPANSNGAEPGTVLHAFLAQHYLNHPPPGEILVSHFPRQSQWLQQVLSEQAGHRVTIHHKLRGPRARWMKMAKENVELALQHRLAESASAIERVELLREEFDLEQLPQRMECFDISHTMGEGTVASCVVFQQGVPLKSDYRHYNIRNVTAGDDYAAMHQALERRFLRLVREGGVLPDLLLIDGGPGQCRQASAVLEELQIEGVELLGVAKGPDRKPGQEKIYRNGIQLMRLASNSPALLLIQQIRDEAHRFAITAHRQRRAKSRQRSALEEIEGIGPRRRQRLLRHFGGMQEITRAGVEDLSAVPGIGKAAAQRIYDWIHRE